MTALTDLLKKLKDQPFICRNGRWASYGEVFLQAEKLGEALLDIKAKPKVSVLTSDTPTYFLAFLACLLIDGIFIPLDVKKGEYEQRRELNAAKPDIVITGKKLSDFVCISVPEWNDSHDLGRIDVIIDKLDSVDMNREFLITFTSGSTAEPKGVVHSFGNLMRSADALGKRFGFGKDDIFYHNFPPSYMAGVLNQFVVPMAFGAKIVMGDRFDVQAALRFWKKAVKEKCNVFWMSPTMLRLLLSVDRDGTGKQYCRKKEITIIVATAPLPLSLRRKFEEAYGVTLYESFGLTETLFNASNHPGRPVLDGCAGYILPGTSVSFQNDGEMTISCDWMFLRYLSESVEKTNRKVFHTGDLAEIRDGALFITGRKKDLIIRGGMNVSPGMIEKELGHLLDMEFCVLGIPDIVMGEKTVLAYADEEEINREKERAINQALIKKLGTDYCIDRFAHVYEIPKTPTGKADKKQLKSNLELMV